MCCVEIRTMLLGGVHFGFSTLNMSVVMLDFCVLRLTFIFHSSEKTVAKRYAQNQNNLHTNKIVNDLKWRGEQKKESTNEWKNICSSLFYLLLHNVLSVSLLLIHKGIASQVNCFLFFSLVFSPIFLYFIVFLFLPVFRIRMNFKRFSSIYVGSFCFFFFILLLLLSCFTFFPLNLILLYDLALYLEHTIANGENDRPTETPNE